MKVESMSLRSRIFKDEYKQEEKVEEHKSRWECEDENEAKQEVANQGVKYGGKLKEAVASQGAEAGSVNSRCKAGSGNLLSVKAGVENECKQEVVRNQGAQEAANLGSVKQEVAPKRSVKAGSGNPRSVKAGSGNPRSVKAGSGNPRSVKAGSGNPRSVKAGSGNPRSVKAGSGNPRSVKQEVATQRAKVKGTKRAKRSENPKSVKQRALEKSGTQRAKKWQPKEQRAKVGMKKYEVMKQVTKDRKDKGNLVK
ncbi:uncharacterized protein LOC122258819 [Penaeus japonicus]|uniref:uncharacterized protein LOC122258819 n=1 Tax=Penaeus japonicus TaxID=27405 RepID=UPI001C7162AA|nr:uncharacterized protein LOC122258819 [Penaeus japonicus]